MTGFTFRFWPQTWGGLSAQPGNYTISWSSHSPGGPLHIFPILTLTLSLALFHSEENLFIIQLSDPKSFLLPHTTGPSLPVTLLLKLCVPKDQDQPAPVPQSSVNLHFLVKYNKNKLLVMK